MKDDEKKSQREDMQFPDEEDMDFEILDALEQLDQSGSRQGPGISDDTIDLTLDDDDMGFGDSALDTEGGFSFDDSLREGLEQELLQGDSDFNIDDSLEDDLVQDIQSESGEDSFALDLDLDDELSEQDMDIESDDSAFDLSAAETRAFNFNERNGEAQDVGGLDELGSYDLDLDSDSDDLDLDSFSDSDEDFPELDLGIEGVEISEEFADLGTDIDLGSSLDQEENDEILRGKSVIAVGDDEVIDLGDEEHLQQEQPPEIRKQSKMPQSEPTREQPRNETETEQTPDISIEEDTETGSDMMLDVHDEEDEEELMGSLGDLDLEEEEDVGLEEMGSLTDEEDAGDFSTEDEEINAVHATEEEQLDSENADMEDLVREVLESQELDKAEEELEIPETEEEPEAEERFEEAPVEEDVDVREFLDLNLRLSDEQIEEFEAMVNEAKTLQTYLDELEEHRNDVQGNIYHKLHAEYIARKTVIFKSSEFTSLLADVEQDLDDMLAKRTEFVETVARLNEELEEIKVRHMVGEYDDSTLHEKQDSQNAEIALWNEKTEKIERFITRYQESLDAEKVLNPLRQEQAESPAEEGPQQDLESVRAEEISKPVETPEAETEVDEEGPFVSEEDTDTEEEEDEEFLSEEDLGEESSVSLAEHDSDEDTEITEEETEGEPDIEDFFATTDEEPEEEDELDEEFPMDGDFETGDFVLDDLSGFEEEEEEEEETSVAYDVEGFDAEDTEASVPEDDDMVTCSKCGRQTPAREKFCVHCGGKAQTPEKDADVSCKKCGRQTPAAEKFCIHCGGKAQ